jgi:hypothetical protein
LRGAAQRLPLFKSTAVCARFCSTLVALRLALCRAVWTRVPRAMRAGVALLALAAASPRAVAQGGDAAVPNATGLSAALPPHTGGASGGLRPLILFHDSFFGRDFVHREYAFEARRPRGQRLRFAARMRSVLCAGPDAASPRAGLPGGV